MKYVKQMKDALTRFNAEARDIRAKIEANNARYQPSVAKAENDRLRGLLRECQMEALDRIEKAYLEATAAATEWGKLRGADVDEDAMKLLRGGFTLDSSALNEMVIKYQGNYTMLNAVQKYAADNGVVLGYVPSAEEKLKLYTVFRDSAGEQIEHIRSEQGRDDWLLSAWGERGHIAPEAERTLCGIEPTKPGEAAPASAFEFSFCGVRPKE